MFPGQRSVASMAARRTCPLLHIPSPCLSRWYPSPWSPPASLAVRSPLQPHPHRPLPCHAPLNPDPTSRAPPSPPRASSSRCPTSPPFSCCRRSAPSQTAPNPSTQSSAIRAPSSPRRHHSSPPSCPSQAPCSSSLPSKTVPSGEGAPPTTAVTSITRRGLGGTYTRFACFCFSLEKSCNTIVWSPEETFFPLKHKLCPIRPFVLTNCSIFIDWK